MTDQAWLTVGALVMSGLSVAVVSLAGIVFFLCRRCESLKGREKDCRIRLATAERELTDLRAMAGQWASDDVDAVIVVDEQTGTILEWPAAATLMLHWQAREMLGKPLTTLIPSRFRERHLAAMAALRSARRAPGRGPHEFVALTREGRELPVRVFLAGWVVGEQRFLGAVLRRRDVASAGSDPAPWGGLLDEAAGG